MGGKSSTSTSQVSIPPEVLAQYNAVNSMAQQTAQTPFQQYGGQFVAPINDQQQAGINATNAFADAAQPYFNAATQYATGAYQNAAPYYANASAALGQAANTGTAYNSAATQALADAAGAGAQGLGAAIGAYGNAYSSAQPYNSAATSALAAGINAAAPLNQAAAQGYAGAYQGAQPYNQAAAQGYAGAYQGAQPYNQAAAFGLGAALQSARPYNQAAGAYDLGGAEPVNAQQIGPGQIGQFESPYVNAVTQSQLALLNQQNQQAQSGQTGNAIMSGAFGGDRSGIAAANLQQQQDLATNSILSNSLNSAYAQALAAAQQQQGVNLGAAQANRAAYQQTGQALQGLGAAQYGQGTGTAQALAALGQQQFGQGAATASGLQGVGAQQFGQGTTAAGGLGSIGQQEYGQGLGSAAQLLSTGQQINQQGQNYGSALQSASGQGYQQGANTAAQAAAIGNQAYGQGLQTAGENATLGSNIYNLGSETAQNLANLGTGAQSAGLAGAQAQQAAGATQQQTQQALDTALYNQFLQQQSYPFQVDQFLANIAEGTGALSGSTTTTTQPGSLFSDERLKENIKPVGALKDGQKIYIYNYKGDPTPRIGLIAQEVEKKYPEAVGESHGFKTVDYGKATEEAVLRAVRKMRAEGGVVNLDDVWQQKAVKGFRDDLLSKVSKRAQDAAQLGREYHESGKLPFPVGARFYTPHSKENGLPPWTVTAHYVDHKDPERYGYFAVRGFPGDESQERSRIMVSDPAADQKMKSLGHSRDLKALAAQFEPFDKPPRVVKATGGGLSFDPQLAAELLQAQEGMYGPYGASSRGASPASGGLYAGLGRVPAANLPVGHLVTSSVQPQRQLTVAEGLAAAGSGAKGAGELWDDGKKLWSKSGLGGVEEGAGDTGYTSPDVPGSYAYGGAISPYGDMPGPGLNIPDDNSSDRKLATANVSAGSGQSNGLLQGLGQVAGAAKGAEALASAGGDFFTTVLPFLGLKSGGRAERKGYAKGGDPSADGWGGPDDIARNLGDPPDGIPRVGVPVGALHGKPDIFTRAQDSGEESRKAFSDFAGNVWRKFKDFEGLNPGGYFHQPQPTETLPPAAAPPPAATGLQPARARSPAPSPHYAGVSNSYGPLDLDALASQPSGLNPTQASTVNDSLAGSAPTPFTPSGFASGLAGSNGSLDQAGAQAMRDQLQAVDQSRAQPQSQVPAGGLAPAAHGFFGSLGDGADNFLGHLGSAAKNYGNELMSGNKDRWLPLLTGLAAFTGAPTRNFGTALAQGLGAGAAAYMPLKQQEARINEIQQEAGRINSATAAQDVENAKKLAMQEPLDIVRKNPRGSIIDAYGNRYSPAGAAGSDAAGPPRSFQYIGPNMAAVLPMARKSFMNDSPAGNGFNPERIRASESMGNDIDETGNASAADLVNLHQQAGAIFSSDRKGPLAQGAMAPIFEPWVAKWNATVGAAVPSLAISGLGDTQIAKKLQLGAATAQATSAGERSYAALNDYVQANAGPGLDPSAAAGLLAKQAVQDTRAIDRRNVLNEARSVGGNYENQMILNAFDKDYKPSDYAKMEDAYKQILLSPEYQNIRKGLSAPRESQQYKTTVATLDEVGKRKGILKLSRMFNAGVD